MNQGEPTQFYIPEEYYKDVDIENALECMGTHRGPLLNSPNIGQDMNLRTDSYDHSSIEATFLGSLSPHKKQSSRSATMLVHFQQ